MRKSIVVNTAAVLAVAHVVAACGGGMAQRPPAIFTPAPVSPVAGEPLAPPPGQQVAGQPQAGQPGAQVAGTPQAAQPSPVATTVTPPRREDVLGQWTIADASSSCQLNVSLTGWSGDYRASTRNCASDDLKKISAWNIEGNNVVLKDQGGAQVALLSRSSERRFDGLLVSGGAVALMR